MSEETDRLLQLLKIETQVGYCLRCHTCSRVRFSPYTGPCGHTRCETCLLADDNCSCGVLFRATGLDFTLNNIMDKRASEWTKRNLNAIYRIPCTDILQSKSIKRTGSGRNAPPNANILEPGPSRMIIENILKERKMGLKPLLRDDDFMCQICRQVLNCTVVIPCGHAFCRRCIESLFNFSLKCPVCRASLSNYELDLVGDSVTYTRLLKVMGHPQIPSDKPLLSDKVVPILNNMIFPTMCCTFKLSKTSERLMIRYLMKSERKVIGLLVGNEFDVENELVSYDYGTILQVCDVILDHNNEYVVTGIGVRRFRVHKSKRSMYMGFPCAEVEDFVPSERKPENFVSLHNEVHGQLNSWLKNQINVADLYLRYGEMPDLEENWEEKFDGPDWVWWALTALPISYYLKRTIRDGDVVECINMIKSHLSLY